MNKASRVLVYNHISEYLDRYEKHLKHARPDTDFIICRTKADIKQHISEADIILSGHTFPVEYLPEAENLKWIQSISAGVENYVFSNKIPAGVVLTKVKGVHGAIMAEYVLGYIFAVTLKMKFAFENQEEREWPYYEPDTIRNKTAGIMGFGSVGSAIAYRLHQNGMVVIGCDEQEKFLPFVDREYSVEEMSDFLQRCDFVVLALPLSPATKGFFGKKQFNAMKESAFLINVSRGALVQEEELIEALETKDIGGAVLDVFIEEPLPKDHGLWNLDNVIITPHISGPSIPEDIIKIFLENLDRFERNQKLVGIVDLGKGY
jgi:D-2-hydroxyacid dehydrogenase (NADP+)